MFFYGEFSCRPPDHHLALSGGPTEVLVDCGHMTTLISSPAFLLHVVSYNITPPQFRSSYLLVSTHFHLPCSHYCLLLRCVVSFDVSKRCHLSVVVSHATYLKNVTGYEITKAGIGRNGVSSSHYLLYFSRRRKLKKR